MGYYFSRLNPPRPDAERQAHHGSPPWLAAMAAGKSTS